MIMRRSADFIQYPGTGMWMMCTRNLNTRRLNLYHSLPLDTIKGFSVDLVYRRYWIDQGAGASTLLRVMQGGKSSSATLVTARVLARYLKGGES